MIEVEFVEDVDAWRQGEAGSVVHVEQEKLSEAPWVFAMSTSTQKIFDDLERRFEGRLLDVADIFVGVQSSADDVLFVIPETVTKEGEVAFKDKGGRRWKIAREATRPALLDRSLSPYEAEPIPDRMAVWPYDIEEQTSGRLRAKLVPPDCFEQRFPKAFKYLTYHRDALANRSVSPDPGDSFYAYGRSQSLAKMEDPKIIVRVLSVPLAPQYVWDPKGLVVPGGGSGPYYLMRSKDDSYPPEVLIALLSHPVIDAFVIAGARTFRGGYAVHSKQSLQSTPVPVFDDTARDRLTSLVTEMQRLSVESRGETDSMRRSSIESRRTFLRGQVEDVVTASLGLDEDDILHFSA